MRPVGLSWRYLKDICGTRREHDPYNYMLMMGLRFMGASPSQEGKWLPYQFALGHCGPYLRLIAVSSSALYARR